MKVTKFIGLVLLVLLAACSNKAVYDSVQNDQRWQCEKEPLSAQQECRERVAKSYDQYERERQELLEGDSASASE